MRPAPLRLTLGSLALLAALTLGARAAAPAAPASAPATLTAAEKAAGWRLLFDGHSLAGWRLYGQPATTAIGPGWKAADGLLQKVAGIKTGDIITEQTFDNFELSWEWRIEKEGNNGVKYFVTEKRSGAPGHEYQMIDDDAPKWAKLHAESKTASFYEVLPPAADRPLNPPGQWNRSRIVVRGSGVEHWLNDRKVLTYELGSAAVTTGIAKSKFAKYTDFGQKLRGHIMLTDHGDAAWFRALKLRELPAR
jgi:hypothetical protein